MKAPSGNASYELAYTRLSADDEASVYVFNIGKTSGFVVTSADDEFPALLGYSDKGSFNVSDAPPAFLWWLGQYADEQAWALSHQATRADGQEAQERENIPFLVKTRWNQSYPYNENCPVYNGRRSVTGCIATAMAQIMKYHEYPEKGDGAHYYKYRNDSIACDFESTVFEWSLMRDGYEDETGVSDEQREAVARLMFACGVSVDMQYTPDESDSYDYLIPYALREYFKYDNDIKYFPRADFTVDQWADTIYSELRNKRPVIVSGQAPGGGHVFICDGYEDGYYHFNWGWGGMCDGNFLLSNLSPYQQGVGGYNGGYNSNQYIIYNIKKPDGGEATTYQLLTSGGLRMDDSQLGDYIKVALSDGGLIYLAYPKTEKIELMLKFTDADGNTYYGVRQTLDFHGTENGVSSGYSGFYMRLPDKSELQPGEYSVTLAYVAPAGNYVDVPFSAQVNSYVNMTVGENGKVTCTSGAPEEEIVLRVEELYAVDKVVSGETTKYFIKVVNESPYPYTGDRIAIRFYNQGSEEVLSQIELALTLAADETYTNNYYFKVDLPDGYVYDMRCFDAYGYPISGVFSLPVGMAEDEVGMIESIGDHLDVYTISGTLLRHAADMEYVRSLPHGVYIISTATESHKLIK